VVVDCVTEIDEKCAKRYLGDKYIANSDNGKIYEGTLENSLL